MITEPWRQGERPGARKMNEERELVAAFATMRGDGVIAVNHIGKNVVIGLDLNMLLPQIPKQPGVPLGTIVLWDTDNPIPAGWLECNAVNAGDHNGIKVPNWADRVPLGIGTHANGDVGGAELHTHGFTVTTTTENVERVQLNGVTMVESAGPAPGATTEATGFPWVAAAYIIRVA